MTQAIEIASRRRTLEIDMPADFRVRATMLIMHYLQDESGEFDASAGYVEAVPYVVIGVADKHYPFTLAEARELAQSLQDTMEKFPQAEASMMVPDLIIALRLAADRIEGMDNAQAGVVN